MDIITFQHHKIPRKCTCKPDGMPLAVISTDISASGNRHVTFNGPGICICDINSIEHICIEVKRADGEGGYIETIDIDPNMFDAKQINFYINRAHYQSFGGYRECQGRLVTVLLVL